MTPTATWTPCLLLLLVLLVHSVSRTTGLQLPLQPPQEDVGYTFEYGVRDEASGTLYGHKETRQGRITTGQYIVHLPDGRIQTVKYTADHNGYRATVSYEGVAHHPDRVSGQQSRTVNYPSVLGGQNIPVLGGATSTLNTNKPVDPSFRFNSVPFAPNKQIHPSVENDRTGRKQIPVVPVVPVFPVVPPPPSSHQQSRPQPRPLTVPFQSQPQVNFVVPAPSSFPGRLWHHFTQSPSIHRDTRLPAAGNFIHQTNAFVVPNNNIVRVPQPFSGSDAPLNTQNFNDFYNLPSSAIRTRPPRVFPTNTFIPSASEPLFPETTDVNAQSYTTPSTQTSLITQLRPTITFSDNDQRNQIDIQNQESLAHQQLPYKTPDVADSGNSLSQLTPPYEGSAGLGYVNPLTQLNPPHEESSYSSVENDKSFSSEDREDYPQIGIAGVQDFSHSFGSSSSEEAQQTTRPIPQPSIVPDYGSVSLLPSPFAPPLQRPFVDSRYPTSYLRPIDQNLLSFTRKPFVIDPDASVFHDEPSIIVDFSHRGSSHEDDSDTVSLTAPYVVVGGAYSLNPTAKFATNPVLHPNSVANGGIAPPDAAESGNIRLSPGFLPPHLAKLHQEISNGGDARHESKTPTPVQLKLSPHAFSGHDDGVNRKNLPLRDRPTTFGEGTPNKFSPNSLTKFAKLNANKKQKRNTEHSSTPAQVENAAETTSNGTSSPNDKVANATTATGTNEEPSFRKIVKRNVSRPNIRNG